VMPVELQRLAPLHGFFKLAGDYPICTVKLDFPRKRQPATVTYATRDFKAKPMLSLEAKAVPAAEQAGVQAEQVQAFEPERKVLHLEATPSETPSQPRRAFKITRSSLESGPEDLEAVLNELAEAVEPSF